MRVYLVPPRIWLAGRVGGWSARNWFRLVEMKEPGVGPAVAVLVGATIIRGVLLPSTMKLLGRWNWYLPRWLEWMPATRFGRHETPGLKMHYPISFA